MEGLKKWIALLATICMLLLSLLSGLISAAPAAEKDKPVEELSITEEVENSASQAVVETQTGEESSTSVQETIPTDESVALMEPVGITADGGKSIIPEGGMAAPGSGISCEDWEVTSLDISKDVDSVTAPGVEARLDKTASDESIKLLPVKSKPLTLF